MAESLQGLSSIIEDLPTLFLISDYVFYVVGILFFGSIAMYGFRGHRSRIFKLSVRILMGSIAMVGGASLRSFFPQLSSGIYGLLGADVLVGSFASSVILGLSLYLITFRLINIKSLKKRISKIEKRIKKAESFPEEKLGIRDPVKIIGIIIILAFILFSLVNFSGFPRTSDRISDSLGLNIQDLQGFQNQLDDIQELESDLPAECDSILSVLQEVGPNINSLPDSSDSSVLTILQEGSSETILNVKQASYNGKEYFLGITEKGGICHSTTEMFCNCIEL